MDNNTKPNSLEINDTVISVLVGNLLSDHGMAAIVNAANRTLAPGGGLCGVIYRASGPEPFQECEEIKRQCQILEVKIAEPVITSSGYLIKNGISHIIHVPGPDCRIAEENASRKGLLKNAYANSMQLAADTGIKTIAFPSLSTGVFQYPVDEASEIAIQAAIDFAIKNNKLDAITFVVLDSSHERVPFQKAVEQHGSQ